MKPSLRRLLLVCLVALAPTDAVRAHQDRIIRRQGDRLVGLPSRYEPAELDLASFRLRIGGRSKEFSPFLKSLFREPYDLELSASWYHERSILPPYLSVRISPKGKSHSHQILFDIDALRLIQIERVVREPSGITRFRRVPLVDLDISKAAPQSR